MLKAIENLFIFSHDILYWASCAHPSVLQLLSGNKSVAGSSGGNMEIERWSSFSNYIWWTK